MRRPGPSVSRGIYGFVLYLASKVRMSISSRLEVIVILLVDVCSVHNMDTGSSIMDRLLQHWRFLAKVRENDKRPSLSHRNLMDIVLGSGQILFSTRWEISSISYQSNSLYTVIYGEFDASYQLWENTRMSATWKNIHLNYLRIRSKSIIFISVNIGFLPFLLGSLSLSHSFGWYTLQSTKN